MDLVASFGVSNLTAGRKSKRERKDAKKEREMDAIACKGIGKKCSRHN